jgi:cytochrome P450
MRPLETRVAMRERHGEIFRSNDAIAGEMFHIAERESVEQVFRWKPAEYEVAEPRRLMQPVTGPSSILLLDGGPHMRMRKLLLPPFHGRAITQYGELIKHITNREVDRWRVGDTVRTRTAAQRITMEVIIRAVFGITDPERIAQLQRVLPPLSSPNPLLLLVQHDLGPRSPWGRFIRRRDHVDRLLYEEINQRRGDPDRHTRNDILTLLLDARDEAGEQLTDRELRDELITLLLAGMRRPPHRSAGHSSDCSAPRSHSTALQRRFRRASPRSTSKP